MYYIYVHVQAIPTYRVYRLCDSTFFLYLDQRALLLGSTCLQNRTSPLCASCLPFFEFESHACHMPSKYHLIIGGSKGKYTKHRWLLYTLGGVKTTPHTNGGNVVSGIFTLVSGKFPVYYCVVLILEVTGSAAKLIIYSQRVNQPLWGGGGGHD